MAHPLMKLRFPVQIEYRLLIGRENAFEGPRILGDLLQLMARSRIACDILSRFVAVSTWARASPLCERCSSILAVLSFAREIALSA